MELTAEGTRVVADVAARHGASPDVVTHLLVAVANGNGTMAQFNHPELGGSGQWMQGGMVMVGDLFDHGLKARVDALCNDLASIVAADPGLVTGGSFQSQSQGGPGAQHQATGAVASGQSQLFAPDPDRNWWPSDLGTPSAVGLQDGVSYAYFSAARRLAVRTGTQIWVYDTLDHQIGGFSQQQGSGPSITFTSQFGSVDLARLPVVRRDGVPVSEAPAPAPSAGPEPDTGPGPMTGSAPTVGSEATGPDVSVFDAIERLGELRDRGLLSNEEFEAKKAELLARL